MLWLVAMALAADPVVADDGGIIVVEGVRSPAAAWDEVRAALAAADYKRGLTLGHTTYFVARWPDRIWKPAIALRDDGLIRVRGRTFTPMLPVAGTPTGGVSAGVTGYWGSPAQARANEVDVIDAVWAPLRDYRDALAAQALQQRIGELEGVLDRVWKDGIAPDGSARTGWQARRLCIAHQWLDTTDTPEGRQVRRWIGSYVRSQIQRGDHPYTEAEIDAINARHTFRDPFPG